MCLFLVIKICTHDEDDDEDRRLLKVTWREAPLFLHTSQGVLKVYNELAAGVRNGFS